MKVRNNPTLRTESLNCFIGEAIAVMLSRPAPASTQKPSGIRPHSGLPPRERRAMVVPVTMPRLLLLLLLAPLCFGADVFEQARRLGRGVNMGNSLEAPKGVSWGRTFGPEDFDRIRAAGFDSVRIPVRWADYAAKEAPFAIDPAFMDKVHGLVRQALDRKLAVVLNV
ncbi:MAG: hypothetical protein RLZZ552_828, partial [Verrucomicrobiota bacterium]